MKRKILSALLMMCMLFYCTASGEEIMDAEMTAMEQAQESIPDVTSEDEAAEAPEIEETDTAILSDETVGGVAGDAVLSETSSQTSNLEILMSEYGLTSDEIISLLGKSAEEIEAMPADKLDYARSILENDAELRFKGYDYSGNCGDNVSWSFDTDSGLLTISGSGKMTNYSGWLDNFRNGWGKIADAVNSVYIGQGVTSIGSFAFYSCSNMSTITIPDSVAGIGYQAFKSCSSLTRITLPDNITTIENSAFEGCSALKSINLPNKITSIGSETFSNCGDLLNITVPNTVTSIGYHAFWECYDLEINIPRSVKSLEEGALFVDKINYEGSYSEWQSMSADRSISGKLICRIKSPDTIAASNIKVNGSFSDQTVSLNASSKVGSLEYSSNNSNVTVDSDGVATVKGGFGGTAVITLKTKSGTYDDGIYEPATKKITIKIVKIAPTFTVEKTSCDAAPKQAKYDLGVKNSAGAPMTYSCSNSKFKISKNGIITVPANFKGSVKITVKTKATKVSKAAGKTFTFKINKCKTELTCLTEHNGYAPKSTGLLQLNVTCNVYGVKLTYKSNNSKIKVSSKGVVTIPKNFIGTAKITVSVKGTAIYTGATETITITYKKRPSCCPTCNGTGVCKFCKGKGRNFYNTSGRWIETCSSCFGSGKCFRCKGTGKFVS